MPFLTPGRTGRRLALMQQLTRWKSGEDNPMGDDNKPAPLRALVLSLPGYGKVRDWGCDAKMDPVSRADEIWQFAMDFTSESSLSGEAQVFMLSSYFGGDRAPGVEFPLQITPPAKFAGPDSPIGDMRDPRQANGTLLREATALTRDAWQFTGGALRIIIENLEAQVVRLTQENQALRAERERAWALQQDLMDRTSARNRQERKDEIQLKVMEMAGAKIVGYIPLLTSKFDGWLAEKFGAKGTPSEEAKRYRDFAATLLSRLSDRETATQVFSAMKLSKNEILQFTSMGRELMMEEEQKTLAQEANDAMRGLTGLAPVRRITSGSK